MTAFDPAKSNLAIVLITGSHTSPVWWTPVVKLLHDSHYPTVVAIASLSACAASEQRQPPATLDDDARHIREVLQALLQSSKDVIMVMVSYGGLPGTEALVNLPSRSMLNTAPLQTGQCGAVVGLVYLCAVLPFVGDSCASALKQPSVEPGTYGAIPAGAMAGIFNDWDPVERASDIEYWSGQTIKHSADSLITPVTHDLWAKGAFEGKVVYVIGELDVVVRPGVAENMVEKANELWEGKIVVKRFADAGHAMQITRPNYVVDTIEELIAALL